MEKYRYVMLAVSILLGVCGQLLLKTGAVAGGGAIAQALAPWTSSRPALAWIADRFLSPWTLGGLVCYFLSAIGYILVLRTVPLSVAYPTVASSYVVVLIASHFLWSEPLTLTSLAGVACIGFGIYLVHHA
ncbi:MAG TPA: hypothetical protein VKS60_15705 [Stellaceae bacterium]|nr:hypothetical protein [Stellaceae bacterium]